MCKCARICETMDNEISSWGFNTISSPRDDLVCVRRRRFEGVACETNMLFDETGEGGGGGVGWRVGGKGSSPLTSYATVHFLPPSGSHYFYLIALAFFCCVIKIRFSRSIENRTHGCRTAWYLGVSLQNRLVYWRYSVEPFLSAWYLPCVSWRRLIYIVCLNLATVITLNLLR